MDLVTLSSATQNIKISSDATDNITKFIMTMSNYQNMRMTHYITFDTMKMIEEVLPLDTKIDKKALCVDILNRVYTLSDDEKNIINRDVELILATEAIIRTPFIKRNLLNCFNYFKKTFF